MTTSPHGTEAFSAHALALKASLLIVWALVSFGVCFFARDLQFMILGWPFNYWMAAQGAPVVFVAILAFHAWAMNRREDGNDGGAAPEAPDD